MAYFDKLDLDPTLIGGGASPEKPKPAGFLRSVADLGIEAASGVARGVKATADAFGADNAVSRGADTVDKFAREYLSAAAKADDQRVSEIMAAAQDAGVWEQVKAAAEAFTVKPAGMVLNAFGTSVPTIAAAMIPGVGQAGVAARLGALGAMGAAQGAGAVKGSIYEAVKAEQIKAGASEAEAEAAAVRAQEYGGVNTPSIVGGAALGGAASATGVQPVIAKLLQRGAEPVAQAQRGILQRALNPEGLVARTGMGALKEAPLEAAQGGQEQYASNIALQNEGFDTPAFRGVAGAAALEGLASAGPGAAFAALDKPKVADVLGAPTVDEAIKKAEQVLALPAPASGVADELVDGVIALPGPSRPAAPPVLRALPAPDGGTVYMVDEAGNVALQPAAARAEAVTRAAEADIADTQQRLAERQRQTELGVTPGLRKAQEDREDSNLPVGEASDAELIPTGEAMELEPIPTGEASEVDVETIQPTDLMARDGQPFGSKTGAQAKAYASGGGKVVAIPNHFGSGIPGYVVRPLMPGRPSNTRGTDARDLPRSSNVNQPDVAGTAGKPVADGAGRPDAAVGGQLAAGRVASDATGQQPGTATAVAPGGAGDAPVGVADATDTALSPGARVTLNGTPYTVTAANSTAVKLQGADGITKMVARNSKTFGQIQAESAPAPAEAPRSMMKSGFDPEAWQKERDDRIKASREAGNTHLDKLPAYVETMRGKDVYYVHDPKVRGRVLTVDNNGNVYVEWLDKYSQDKEGATPMKMGKRQVMQSSLGPRDLKDYVAGKPTQEPNEAARPQPEAQRAEAAAPAAAPAPAAPAVVPGTTSGAVEADGVDDSIDPFTLDKRTLNARIDRLVSAGEATDSIGGFMELRKRYMKATGKPSIPPAGSRFVALYPDGATLTAEAVVPGAGDAAVQADGVKAPESALRQALRSVGIDPDAPRDKAKDKARGLRKQADELMNQARKMLEGIPPGQPVRSTRDANLRERAREKTRKAADLQREADALEATPQPTSGEAAPAPAPEAEPQEKSADDYLAELFGTPAEQAAAQERFMAAEAQRKQDEAKATEAQRADAKRIRDAIGAEVKRAQAEHDDWSSRTYKRNKTQVDLQGDGPSSQGSMSIGAINESRRRNAMEALTQELKALDKLGAAVATDSGAEQFMGAMRDLYARAEKIAADGNGLFKTPGEQFQYMLLDDLKFRGPAGKGNVTSNGLSKAVLSAVKPEAAPAERTPKAQAVKEALAATHKDPGEPAEPVTPAVVREAIKTGVQDTGRKPSAMKAELLAKIDAAMEAASSDEADERQLALARYPARKPTKDEVRTYMVQNRLNSLAAAEEKMVAERERSARNNAAAVAERIGYVTFSVPGDGVFKVVNTRDRLAEFRRKVEGSGGFKDRQSAPAPDRDGSEKGSGSKLAAFDNMVNEGDLEAASDYADAVGLELDPKKIANATKVLKWRETRTTEPAPAPAAEAPAAAPAPAADDRVLTIESGGSTQTLTLPKPAWQATDDELVQAVKDSGTYLGKPGSKYDPYRQWREAHSEAITKAARDGRKFPDELLYDKPALIRTDLNDDQADEASDAMVAEYRATKDYGKAVAVYREWGKKPATPAAQAPAGRDEQPEAQAPAKPAPKSFRKSVKVKTAVFMEETSTFAEQEIDADAAIKALEADIAELQAFRNCIAGG